jgi:hypothetical protein
MVRAVRVRWLAQMSIRTRLPDRECNAPESMLERNALRLSFPRIRRQHFHENPKGERTVYRMRFRPPE